MSMLRDTAGEKDFEPPTEFIKLLTLADAIGDPDKICLKFPPVVGVNYRLTRYARLDHQPRQSWYKDGWQVITGWECGDGTTTSATLLLYAYKYSGGTPKEQVPQWRVYTWSEGDELWFPSIADFVYFRCRWKEWMSGGLSDDLPDAHWLYGGDGNDEDEDEDEDGE
ncbi:hypothetical protein VHEMI01739 [[Torrubiella] hemipterigena]|uniref:Uncharacterized protein n=1 Tax=[Torrubiella] hemipterigena TaxID=1531966 RepID=A0A0A1T8E8_9HYPO|nr:hypothetical protein VHEMI01739 [[Torrubiella] hemipterigena]